MIGTNVKGLAAMGSVIGLTLLAVACSGSQPTDPLAGDTAEQDNKQGAPAGGDAKSAPNDPAKNSGANGGANGTNGPDGKAGNNGTPNNPNNPGGNPGGNNPGGNNPGGNGEDGEVGRVSVNEHCCFAGKYQRCPSSNACFGGFDIDACLQNCNPLDPCFDECFDKMDKAGPPKGCDANAQPPPGVDCAKGQINI